MMSTKLAHFNQRQRDGWVAKIAKQLPRGTHVLDVGAGEARYRTLFAHCEYKTQDFGEYTGTTTGNMREEWSYTKLDYISDASAIPVEDSSFDVILCTEVLEHVPEPILVVKEISRILRPGGHAYISAPLGSGLHQQPYHFYGGFTPYFYERFFTQFGCRIIAIEANGNFFRLLLQEIDRATSYVWARQAFPRWHPARWLFRILASHLVAKWLVQLDERFPISEFTVGYHVEVEKL